MKRTIRILGFAAFVTVIGLTFTACALPDVSISGTPRVGHTLTATSQGANFEGGFFWDVSSLDGPFDWGGLGIWSGHGSNNQNLELTTGLVGRHIRAARRTAGGDTLFSNIIGPIQAP